MLNLFYFCKIPVIYNVETKICRECKHLLVEISTVDAMNVIIVHEFQSTNYRYNFSTATIKNLRNLLKYYVLLN